MPKKAATPKKGSTKKEKGDSKKSLHQEFADIIAGVDVEAKKPERKKKEVDRFDLEVLSLVPPAKRETVFEAGSGSALREVHAVAKNLREYDADAAVVKKLHQLLYGRPGKAHETKKNILRYNGLASKTKKEGRDKFHSKLITWKLNDLRAVAKIFALESGGSKDELIDSIVEFLVSPKASKIVPKKKAGAKKKKSITKKKPLGVRKTKKSSKSGSESEGESSAVESESAAESEKETASRGRKRKASPSPRRGKKASASPKKKKAPSKSRSRSRSPAPAKKGSAAAKKGGSKASPAKRKASPSPKRASRSRSRSPAPAKKPSTPKKGGSKASPAKRKASPKKPAAGSKASPAKKGSTAKKPAPKKRKTN